jgi:hypothetical protein
MLAEIFPAREGILRSWVATGPPTQMAAKNTMKMQRSCLGGDNILTGRVSKGRGVWGARVTQ